MMEFTAEMIAGFLGGDIVGDKTVKVHTVSSIEEGKAGSMAYLVNPKYEPFLYTTEASIVLVDRSFTPQREVKPTLVKVDDAGAAVLRLLEMYNAARPQKKGVSERASISPEASLGEGCYVGDFAVIEAGARIGDGCRIYPQVYVGDSVEIGEGTTLVADASVKGLPDIRKTRFDLSVPRLRSTARAVDELALGIAGRKLSDKLVGVLGNSGQIDLNARFRGLLSSFDMQLGAATGVGDVSCNLKMAPVKGGLSSVRGDVETRNLRLGELLGRRDLLGNATLSAYIDGVVGKGYTDANVVGNVTQLGFNDYIYCLLYTSPSPRD